MWWRGATVPAAFEQPIRYHSPSVRLVIDVLEPPPTTIRIFWPVELTIWMPTRFGLPVPAHHAHCVAAFASGILTSAATVAGGRTAQPPIDVVIFSLDAAVNLRDIPGASLRQVERQGSRLEPCVLRERVRPVRGDTAHL